MLPLLSATAHQMVLNGSRDTTQIAQKIAGSDRHQPSVTTYLQYREFKTTLKRTPNGQAAYANLKKHGAIADIKKILKLDECREVAEFRKFKKLVKQNAVQSVDDFKAKNDIIDQTLASAQKRADQIQSEASSQAHTLIEDAKRSNHEAKKAAEATSNQASAFIDKLSAELNSTLGALNDGLKTHAKYEAILHKAKATSEPITFKVGDKTYPTDLATVERHHDFLIRNCTH